MSTIRVNELKTLGGVSKQVKDIATYSDLQLALDSDYLTFLTSPSDFPAEADNILFQDTTILLKHVEEGKNNGGIYTYDALRAKSQHNGRTVISPTVPAIPLQPNGYLGYLNAEGESEPSGLGVFVKNTDFDVKKVLGPQGKHLPFMVNYPMGGSFITENNYNQYNGETVHPSIIRVEGGFGPQGFEYWQVITPYVYQNDQTENPYLYASHNGIDWEVPNGLTNPLAPSPGSATSHLSDVNILKVDQELWIYYRETNKNTNTSVLYRITSSDGVNWSPPTQLSGALGESISPSIKKDGTGFVMWLVRTYGVITRFESTNGIAWFSGQDVTISSNYPSGKSPWHLDTIKNGNVVQMLLLSSSGPGGQPPADLHYLVSYDNGQTFQYINAVINPSYDFEILNLYKAGWVPHKDGSSFDIWWTGVGLSGSAALGRWRTSYSVGGINNAGELVLMVETGDKKVYNETLVAPSAMFPKLSVGRLYNEQPRLMLGVSSDTNVPSRGTQNVVWDRAFYDNFGLWMNDSSAEIVVPTGFSKCRITYQCNWTAGGVNGVRRSLVLINGTHQNHPGIPSVYSTMDATDLNTNASSGLLSVLPGDVITLQVANGSVHKQAIQNSSWIEVTFY